MKLELRHSENVDYPSLGRDRTEIQVDSSLTLYPPSVPMSRSRSSSPSDPLARFFGSSSNTSSANTSSENLSTVALVPAQIPTTLHQVKELSFRGLNHPCKLAVDASPGCGGIVWPAGEVRHPVFTPDLAHW